MKLGGNSMDPIVFYSTFRKAVNNTCDNEEKIKLHPNGHKTRHYQLCIEVLDRLVEEYNIIDIPFAYGWYWHGYFSYGLDKLYYSHMNNFNMLESEIDRELLPKMEKIIGDIKHNYMLPKEHFRAYLCKLPKKQGIIEFYNRYNGLKACFNLILTPLNSSNIDIEVSLLKDALCNFESCLNLEYNKDKREEICLNYLNLSLIYCDNYQDFPKNMFYEMHSLFKNYIYGISLPYMEHLVFSDSVLYNNEALPYSKKQKILIENYCKKYEHYEDAYNTQLTNNEKFGL